MSSDLTKDSLNGNDRALSLLHRIVSHLSRHTELFGMDDADEQIFLEYVDVCRSLGVPVCQELISAAKASERMMDEDDVATILLRIKLKPGCYTSRNALVKAIHPGWRLVEFDCSEKKPIKKGIVETILKRESLLQTTILMECKIIVYNKDDFGDSSVAAYLSKEPPVREIDIEEIELCEARLDDVLYKFQPGKIGDALLQK